MLVTRVHRPVACKPIRKFIVFAFGKQSTGMEVRRILQERATSHACAPPLILSFTADFCGPCKLVHKELYKLDMHFNGNMKPTVLSINIESEKEFADSMGICSIPTLVFVGQANPTAPALMVKGVVSKSLLVDIVENKTKFAGADVLKPQRL